MEPSRGRLEEERDRGQGGDEELEELDERLNRPGSEPEEEPDGRTEPRFRRERPAPVEEKARPRTRFVAAGAFILSLILLLAYAFVGGSAEAEVAREEVPRETFLAWSERSGGLDKAAAGLPGGRFSNWKVVPRGRTGPSRRNRLFEFVDDVFGAIGRLFNWGG
ncbi:hypothetical protein [Paludisphaera mucosa]|uniref:Uncharacterized protein n=1 Tax=Paludisphaera mucosa TaxID=3030827 RepID=A0ABT6FLK6_9BACT|nr:hypothetical protein [Paludisphaera mucosa]MDG3008465.1 hypothetical protein [Paludisphaera mucosa]